MRNTRRRRGTALSTIACSSAVALLLAAPGARADRGDGSVTAIDARAFARRFAADNPGLDAIEADVAVAGADVTEASRLPNPSLSYEREELFPDGGGEAENALTLGWTIDLSGRRSRRTDAARARVRAARARADDGKLAALIEALGTFYDAAHARLRVEALREGREPLARMVGVLRARVAAGDAAGYDLTRLELELAAYDERIADATAELGAARIALGGLIGELSARYDADDELALPQVPDTAAALVDDALAERGDYRATAFDAASADAELSAADRGWVPLLDVGFGLKTAELGTETATGYVAAIGLELPLLSRGQADAERARARRRAADAHRAQLERRITTEVRVAYERLAASVQRVETFRAEQLDRARTLVGKAEAVYDSGDGSVVELTDAYRTAVDVRLRYLELLRRAKAAQLALSLALGRAPELMP